jgi:hypothetical protein
LAVIGCLVSIILKLIGGWIPSVKSLCNDGATVVGLGTVTALAVVIFLGMVKGAAKEIADKKAAA